MAFKEGDTVKILDRVGGKDNYCPAYTDDMLKYAGTLTTIKDINGYGSLILDNNGYFWDTKAVKLVNEDKYLHPAELKDGDFIKIWNDSVRFIYIFKKYKNNSIYRHASFDLDFNETNINSDFWGAFEKSTKITYATEEEKNLLNAELLKKGYIWNNSTKKLETIQNPTFLNSSGIGLINYPITSNIKYNISLDLVEENMNKEELNLFPTKKHYQLNFNY